MVSGLAGLEYKDRLEELGLDTLEERRLLIDMTQVYKVLNGKDKVSSDTWFASAATGARATRAAAITFLFYFTTFYCYYFLYLNFINS